MIYVRFAELSATGPKVSVLSVQFIYRWPITSETFAPSFETFRGTNITELCLVIVCRVVCSSKSGINDFTRRTINN